tara:strand:- start:1594 stop:2469 length:876 start_codon:yes stop_codon:yes gene_type:complete
MDSSLKKLINEQGVSLININLLSEIDCKKIKNHYNYIYHLAAVIGVKHVLASPQIVLSNNFLLLNNAIAIAKRQKNLDRFVFASTSEVYAGTLAHFGLEFPTLESTVLTVNDLSDARSSYMLSKIYGEALCFQSGLPITIIRPHNFYGPRMGLSHVIPELMKKVIKAENKSIEVFSIGHKRTFCFIDDATEMITLLAESKKSKTEVYNIGNEIGEIKMGDLAKMIINLISKEIKIESKVSNNGSPERRCPDISKLQRVISYHQKYSLEEGLKETFSWYKKNVFSGNEASAI